MRKRWMLADRKQTPRATMNTHFLAGSRTAKAYLAASIAASNAPDEKLMVTFVFWVWLLGIGYVHG